MTPTPITREAVEARVALLRSDYAADGAAFDADMLLALLSRAEKSEEMAQFYKDAFRKMEADFGAVCAERDEAREKIRKDAWLVEAHRNVRDKLQAEVTTLTSDLTAARKTIEGMREALQIALNSSEYTRDDGGTNCRFCDEDMDHEGTFKDMHNKDCIVHRFRAALAQANKTEGV